ncbi:hypothetical protein ACIA8K_14255 [Catenuloplanes sp. NPDC051500]|uniref:hypothetical protein n=1 Tax=Catenuloplanes sp. NPDC051500 TaxID=3363959 RepID=UPI0037995182
MTQTFWSYLGDEGTAKDFDAEVKRRKSKIVMAPSTLIEVVRLSNPEVRQKIIQTLTSGPRHRLTTEVHLECLEVVSEAKRVRPKWLHQVYNAGRISSLNTYWTKTIWSEAVNDSQRLYTYETSRLPERDLLTSRQRETRKQILQDKFDIRPLTALTADLSADTIPAEFMEGWPGHPVEAWRVMSWTLYWNQLVRVPVRAIITKEDRTVADWAGAYLKLESIRSEKADFLRFWATDVELSNMPRNWLRWAVNVMQMNSKVTPGNPADEQHSAYLVDCDVYLSADANYVKILNEVRTDAPFSFAEPCLVSGDKDTPVVDRIIAAL